jgi:hypothetical protein
MHATAIKFYDKRYHFLLIIDNTNIEWLLKIVYRMFYQNQSKQSDCYFVVLGYCIFYSPQVLRTTWRLTDVIILKAKLRGRTFALKNIYFDEDEYKGAYVGG